MNDATAIAKVLAGDRDAFRRIVERYKQPVFAFIRTIVHNAAEAEDVAQETLLKAFRKLASYDSTRGTVITWLLTIARSESLNSLRRRRPQTGLPMEVYSDHSSPEHQAAEAEAWQTMQESLKQLPLEQRTAFVLFDLHGCSYEEVANIEQVPVGTVKSRIARARHKLWEAVRPLTEHEQ